MRFATVDEAAPFARGSTLSVYLGFSPQALRTLMYFKSKAAYKVYEAYKVSLR